MASSSSPLADRLKHIILNSTARRARETPCCSEIWNASVLLISHHEHEPPPLARTRFPNPPPPPPREAGGGGSGTHSLSTRLKTRGSDIQGSMGGAGTGRWGLNLGAAPREMISRHRAVLRLALCPLPWVCRLVALSLASLALAPTIEGPRGRPARGSAPRAHNLAVVQYACLCRTSRGPRAWAAAFSTCQTQATALHRQRWGTQPRGRASHTWTEPHMETHPQIPAPVPACAIHLARSDTRHSPHSRYTRYSHTHT